MNFSELIETTKRKTIQLIKDNNWKEIFHIFQIAPKQIYSFSKTLEANIKNSTEFNELPFIVLRTEGGITYFNFNELFDLILKLLRAKRDLFSDKFRNLICAKIFSQISQVKVFSSTVELFVDVLHPEILNFSKEELMNHRYNSRILYRLFKINPEQLIQFLPDIVTQGWYDFGYEIIIKFPEIIKVYEAETKKIFENIILHEKQYFSLIQLLEKEGSELIPVIENKRENLKQEYYEKLISSQKDTIEHEWFYPNKFRYIFELFTDNELIEIIKKIIDLEIDFSHYGESDYRSSWANLIILEIGWIGKRKLFIDFLEKLARLGYLQAVREFFSQFPERIKESKELIFEKLGSFGIDLLEKHYEAFEIEDPVSFFEDNIKKSYYTQQIINIFFNNNQELIPNFIEVIKDYFQQMASFQTRKIDVQDYYKINTLLRAISLYYPNYLSEFDAKLVQSVFQKLLSIPDIAEQFNPIANIYLPDKFNLFDTEFQEKLIKILIEDKKLSSIEFFLKRNFQNFVDYLEDIINYQPIVSLESEHLIRVLELILKNKYDLNPKITERLNELDDCSRKAQLYSFLGELNLSKQVLKRILENELIIPHIINTYIDYQLVNIELFAFTTKAINLSDYFTEFTNVEKDFEDFNSSQSLRQNFLFKLNSYKARLYFYSGFQYLQNGPYNKSKIAFEKSFNLYDQLKRTKVIQDTTRRIFETYSKISDFFRQYMSSIKRLIKKEDYNGANSLIKRHFEGIIEQLPESNIQLKRLFNNIENIQFDLESKSINQLKCEIPTKFCPRPPIILQQCFMDDIKEEPLIIWDKDNRPLSLEPIEVSSGSKKYFLIMEFAEKERFFDFNLELKEKSYFKITDLEIKPQAGRIHFEFILNFNEFHGEDDLQFVITENDICGFELKLSFFIIHKVTKEEISIKTDEIPDFEYFFKRYNGIIEDMAREFAKFEHKNGKTIDKKAILDWLLQFDTPYEANLALKILLKINFIERSRITSVIKELLTLTSGKEEIVVSPLGGPADSSSHIIYYFKDLELTDKIKEMPLRAILDNKNPENTIILFLDDIIQTGNQVLSIFQQLLGLPAKLNEAHEVKLKKRQIKKLKKFKLLFLFIIGFSEHENDLIKNLNDLGFFNIQIHSYYKEVKYTSCFHSTSGIFKDTEERKIALEMCKDIGFQLFEDKTHWSDEKKRKNSLGYGNAQKLIVFPYNVPTTTLPILWKRGKYNGKIWEPLFLRRKKE